MKKAIEGEHWYFVDETGDTTFYDRRGNLLIGQPGVSPILGLGFIETGDPHLMRQALARLHADIIADPYLQSFPSSADTGLAFHAKDDRPEVRHLVFNLIRTLDFKAQFVIARKIERVFRNSFGGQPQAFYDHLVSHLFTNVLHRHTRNHIYFAKRGSRSRQRPLLAAIKKGMAHFEEKWSVTVKTESVVLAQVPSDEPCLQVIDYMNWAVYRAFVAREMRYFRLVEDKVSLLVDLYDAARYPNNWYSRENPFDMEKASPL
ncbi:MAG: hypothetical protein HY023_03270 [Chloroflexi bacterium]|nr:hypothetical protein [Chloroflexota bacterium]MBI3762217.1 hypothetical protein [Chloroflexota bacterium]